MNALEILEGIERRKRGVFVYGGFLNSTYDRRHFRLLRERAPRARNIKIVCSTHSSSRIKKTIKENLPLRGEHA